MGAKTWADGRAKIWYEVYSRGITLDAYGTLKEAVKFANSIKWNSVIGIVKIQSQGGWKTSKPDKEIASYKMVGGKAIKKA